MRSSLETIGEACRMVGGASRVVNESSINAGLWQYAVSLASPVCWSRCDASSYVTNVQAGREA